LQYLEQTLKSSYCDDQLKTLDQRREALLRKISEKLVNDREMDEDDIKATTEKLVTEFTNYRPVGNLTQKVAAKMIKWPMTYGIARYIYRLFRRLRG
jgi:uncharacterized protein YpuA (DUF1002 family)